MQKLFIGLREMMLEMLLSQLQHIPRNEGHRQSFLYGEPMTQCRAWRNQQQCVRLLLLNLQYDAIENSERWKSIEQHIRSSTNHSINSLRLGVGAWQLVVRQDMVHFVCEQL